jgi:hypothetical protein
VEVLRFVNKQADNPAFPAPFNQMIGQAVEALCPVINLAAQFQPLH